MLKTKHVIIMERSERYLCSETDKRDLTKSCFQNVGKQLCLTLII